MAPIPSGPRESDKPQIIDFCSTVMPLDWEKIGGALRPNEPKDVTVKFTTANGPNEIYVIKVENEKALDALNEQLDYYVSELIATGYWDYSTFFREYYKNGICVAAKDMEHCWARALVLNVHEGEERKIDVFFVDHGDTRYGMDLKDIFPLPRRFYDQLTFQVIALSLEHVEPAHASGVWTKKVAQLMDAILVSANQGISASLEIVALEKIGPTGQELGQEEVVPKYYSYSAFVFTDTEHELGETLVRTKLAIFKDEEGYQKKKRSVMGELAAKYAKLTPADINFVTDDDDELGAAGFDESDPLLQLGNQLKGFDFFDTED